MVNRGTRSSIANLPAVHPQPTNVERQLKIAGRNLIRTLSGLALFVLTLNCFSVAQASKPAGERPKSARLSADTVSRGKYIVEDVAVCGQCHTPRNSNGQPDRARLLEGAAVWLKSAEPDSDWPLLAPRIAGTPPGTDAEMVTLLTTGIWRGAYLRPPMPQFRMEQHDAEAVVAYLKSVNPQAK